MKTRVYRGTHRLVQVLLILMFINIFIFILTSTVANNEIFSHSEAIREAYIDAVKYCEDRIIYRVSIMKTCPCDIQRF